jgi:hypothetical protein
LDMGMNWNYDQVDEQKLAEAIDKEGYKVVGKG